MGKHDTGIVGLAAEYVFDLHDALISPLADKDLQRQAELFRMEQERRSGRRVSEMEWTQQCIRYVENHHYRTRYAQLEYDRGCEANLIKLYKLLREQQEEAAAQKDAEAKIFIAIYSMRIKPRKLEGPDHGSNVFVFDSSVPVTREQFRESMAALALDGPGLQKAMVDQLFFSRGVLNARAKALRVTYDVFIYGLALSLAAFAWVLVRQ
jgi:hypothetical protein